MPSVTVYFLIMMANVTYIKKMYAFSKHYPQNIFYSVSKEVK